jgi:hypothetical protein
MKKSVLLLIILPLLVLNSCSPKIAPTITSKQNPISEDEIVLVIDELSFFENDGIKVGTVKSTDKGFSTNCNYDDLIATIKKLCRENGANILKINNHKLPDQRSSCDRIEATLYKVPNYKIHEKKIEWSKERKLTWYDFKQETSPISALGYGAETSCELELKSNNTNLFSKAKLKVTNTFFCNHSWVNLKNTQNDILLEHEQLHFDLSEVYARELRKKIIEKNFNIFNLMKESDKLFKECIALNKERQSLYDKETSHGIDTLEQKKWKKNIEMELSKLQDFSTN